MSPAPSLPDDRLTRLFRAYVALAQRRAGLLLLGFLVLLGLALIPVSSLSLATDMAEILPREHPAVIALRRLSGRQKSSTNLVVLVQSPDATANGRFVAALLPELGKLVPSIFSEIESRPDTTIPDFARRWQWLYAEQKDLLEAEELLERLINARKSPLLVDLEGDPEAELRALRARLDKKLPTRSEEPAFRAEFEGAQVQGVLLWRRGDGVASQGDQQTMQAVAAVIERLGPLKFHPRMTIEYTGNIAAALAEHDAVRDDLTWSTAICLSLVLLVIYLYFRRFGLILVIGAPAVLGLILALALARFTVGSLNANTAFLLSIILGNGINSPIILLARYGEERQAHRAPAEALLIALRSTLLATGLAMGAASVSYACLLLTKLRGLSQFGLVGGSGMVLVWLMAFLLVPPLVLFGERLRPGALTPRQSPLWRAPFTFLGRLAARRSTALGLLSVALCLASAVPLYGYLRDPLEWDLRKLRSSDPAQQKKWDKMYRVGIGGIVAGYISTDGILLVDRPEQADPVAAALRQKDEGRAVRLIKEVRTLNSVLPKEQEQKLAILKRIRARLDQVTPSALRQAQGEGKDDARPELMSAEEWQDLKGFRPPDYLRPLVADDLPRPWLESFTEVDGTRGRLVGIDLDPSRFDGNDGHDLFKQADAMQVQIKDQSWVAASYQTIFAGILEIIQHDMKRLTLAALGGVALLTLLCFGLRGAVPVLLALLTGVLWLGGLLATFKLKLNFLNFVALPITLGVGVDYAANIWARLRRESSDNRGAGAGLASDHMAEVIAATGSAVSLCSLTTIIGYSTLLRAGNRALQSFGLLADLGEITCLCAALLALPALAGLMLRPRAAVATKAGSAAHSGEERDAERGG